MIAIVGTIIRTKIIDTMDVQIHRKRVVNGNVLIVTNMLANLSLEQHIARRKNKGAVIMTIDEAIQRARDNENIFKNNHKLNLTLKARSPYYGLDCLRISDDNKHLAEWLEELKAYRTNDGISENVYRSGYKFGYNKAVDDCIEELKKRRNARYMKVNCDDVELKMLSEKLKGVIQNEDCITSKQKFQRS
jgi:hypothetical protein